MDYCRLSRIIDCHDCLGKVNLELQVPKSIMDGVCWAAQGEQLARNLESKKEWRTLSADSITPAPQLSLFPRLPTMPVFSTIATTHIPALLAQCPP